MEKDAKRIPDWASRERESDLEWIRENLEIFWGAAQTNFKEYGRGVLVCHSDTIIQHARGTGNPFIYLTQKELGERSLEWSDTLRMVTAYDPLWEFVLVILKSKLRESVYRVGIPDLRK